LMKKPTIKPMMNGIIITTIGGIPPMLPDVINPNISSKTPKIPQLHLS
jgi:hypothetical protein